MSRSKSSKQWLNEHFDDIYVKLAKKEGFRGRAAYKLIEIDEKEQLIQPGMLIVDLGAAPGSWSQYVSQKLNQSGHIIALDILPFAAIPEVQQIIGDFTEDSVYQILCDKISTNKVDLVLSDMAPNFSGTKAVDIAKAMYLCELALDFSQNFLKQGGSLFIKVFHGEGFDALLKNMKQKFMTVQTKKPKASRSRSRETYLLAKGFKL